VLTFGDLIASNAENRPRPLAGATLEPKDGTSAHRRETGPIPVPTLTTLRISGQVRPGQHAPDEIALDHEVTFVPFTGPAAHGFERACNLRVDDAVIGWVAYGQVRGGSGWVWGSQLASDGSFRSVAPSRSAAAFCELLAAVRDGTVADARSTTLA